VARIRVTRRLTDAGVGYLVRRLQKPKDLPRLDGSSGTLERQGLSLLGYNAILHQGVGSEPGEDGPGWPPTESRATLTAKPTAL
jgi:hypothetical protein